MCVTFTVVRVVTAEKIAEIISPLAQSYQITDYCWSVKTNRIFPVIQMINMAGLRQYLVIAVIRACLFVQKEVAAVCAISPKLHHR